MTAAPLVRTAAAAERPCELYAHSAAPHPIRTQGHHRFPVYLQRRLWGEVRVHDLMWVCGLCHDSLHEVIANLLGEGRTPNPPPGRNTLTEARRTVALYRAAQEPTP